MGRKRINDLLSYKFSMDLNGENKVSMDEITENFQVKYGPFVNLLIKSFCRMPDRMKEAFIAFCIEKCKELNEQIVVAGEIEKKGLEDEKNRYLEIARIINGGIEIAYEDDDPTMKKIALKDGILIIPKDWILLNPEQAPQYSYAGVVECRNSDKYGIPHFCFFTNYKHGCDYTDDFTEHIEELCCQKWPEFRDIMKKEVKLIPDPEHKGKYLNAEEHLASPVIGHFHITSTDDEYFDENPPYGAMIIRKNKTNDNNEN